MHLISGDSALIKVDIDKGKHRPNMHEIVRRLTRAGYTYLWMSETCSKSGGFHIVLAVSPEPVNPLEVVAIQAILGSDPNREACNLHRAKMLPRLRRFWRERWNVLYQRRRMDGP